MRFHPVTRGAALGALLATSAAGVAQAATGSGESTPLHLGTTAALHTTATGSSGSSILRTIVALVIVSAIIYAIAKILRAVKGRGETRASGEGLSQIASLPLGAGRSLALIRSGRDVVLLGVAEQGVTKIKTYTEEEARAVGIDVPPPAPAGDVDQAERPLGRVIAGLRRMTVRP
ncbi:MAG: flagellar biosynthetic protein FliO [Solirubrobacteraceae bacterium]|jgi:flagellar protein FliO/FliZ